MFQIRKPSGAQDLAAIRNLFKCYADWLGVDLEFQSFDKEMRNFPHAYCALLMAVTESDVVGAVALKPLAEQTCEMKRLYCKPEARGEGVGRALATQIIAQAKSQGFERMRLDTLASLKIARRLYESLGFRQIEAYYDSPLDDVIYMELDLRHPA